MAEAIRIEIELSELKSVLRSLVECATDLKCEVDDRYGGLQQEHPTLKRRYLNDIEPSETATTKAAVICSKYDLEYPDLTTKEHES